MSVITNSPVPQMQLHAIFTELHTRPGERQGRAGRGPSPERGLLQGRSGSGLGAGQGEGLHRGGSGRRGQGAGWGQVRRRMEGRGLRAGQEAGWAGQEAG